VEGIACYRLGVLYQFGEPFDHAHEAFARALTIDPT
jgi:hypothetical protein